MSFRRTLRLACIATFCLSGIMSAQTGKPSSVADRAGVRKFTNEKLNLWQQRLELADWQISVVLVRRESLPPQTLGGIHWDQIKKAAQIWVLDPADYQLAFEAMLDDMERTIVHELVHLSLSVLPHGKVGRGSEEETVNDIVQAMLMIDRERKPAL